MKRPQTMDDFAARRLRPLGWVLVIAILAAAGCRPSNGSAAVADPSGKAKATAETDGTKSGEAAPGKSPPLKLLLSNEELREGWIALFDGETLFGWRTPEKTEFKVEGGVIKNVGGEPGLLCTTTQWSDYVLRVDFRSEPGVNSGVFLRTPAVVRPADVETQCYELNIAAPDESPFPTGSFVKRKKVEGDFTSGKWQTYEVTAKGGEFTVKLDGKQILSYTDPKPVLRGLIGLQHNKGHVEFRNIRLRPLGTESLFDGKTLEGWKTYPKLKTEASVTDKGELRLRNGKGQLETAKSYGDFVLQLEAFTNGAHLNSGVFFRSIPGDEMNGYECQIQNGLKGNDRTQPQDCGTGGIFRRQEARRVNANDFEWFSMTIAADGPHLAAWVNGLQVSDWTDDRPPHENPRQGKRLEAGTIILQGHDATTDVSFRNLRIAPLAASDK